MFKFNKSWKIICVVMISFSMLTHVSKIYNDKKKRGRCNEYCEKWFEERQAMIQNNKSNVYYLLPDLEACISNCKDDILPTETGEEYWKRMKSERKLQWQ